MELETPDPVTIPTGAEAIVQVQLQAHPTWREPCGLVGQPIQDLVMGRALVNTTSPIVAGRVINLRTELHTIGCGVKVACCTPIKNIVDVRDQNIQLDRPQRESLETDWN